jgi:hypothetical protein
LPNEDKKEIVTSLRVDSQLWKAARKAAIDCDTTLGEIINEALREWLQKQEQKDNER